MCTKVHGFNTGVQSLPLRNSRPNYQGPSRGSFTSRARQTPLRRIDERRSTAERRYAGRRRGLDEPPLGPLDDRRSGRCRARTRRPRQLHRGRRPGRSPDATAPQRADAPKRQGRTMVGVPFDRRSTVRVGIVGLGNRGGSMIDLFLAVSGVQIVAVCDPVKDKAQRAAAKVTAAGQLLPPSTPMARTTTRTSASAGTSTSSMWRPPGTSTSRWRRPLC